MNMGEKVWFYGVTVVTGKILLHSWYQGGPAAAESSRYLEHNLHNRFSPKYLVLRDNTIDRPQPPAYWIFWVKYMNMNMYMNMKVK